MNNYCEKNEKCRYETFSHFKAKEVILSVSDLSGRLGVLVSGEARVIQLDEHGVDHVVDILRIGDGFGEQFAFELENQAIYIIADTECDVHFINLRKVLSGCDEKCAYKEILLKKMLLISCQHAKKQNMRLESIRQRSLREKILTYLHYQECFSPDNDKIIIPITLKELANYLCVDRCAMMREIKKMNEDGIIKSSGRTFILCEGK